MIHRDPLDRPQAVRRYIKQRNPMVYVVPVTRVIVVVDVVVIRVSQQRFVGEILRVAAAVGDDVGGVGK